MAKNEENDIKDKIESAKKAAEEISKLAANVSSGNWIGAAKNALELLKDKKIRKIIIRKLMFIILLMRVLRLQKRKVRRQKM